MSIAIITGASSGIGREFALAADRLNIYDELWLISRRKERLEKLTQSLSCKSRILALDLTQRESFDVIRRLLGSAGESVGLLINAAGEGKFSDFIRQDEEEIDRMISLNVSATVMLCRISLPYMRRGGKIINMSSVSGALPLPGFNIYAATKAFIRSFTIALDSELAKIGVTATAVCPFWMNTEFISNAGTVKRPVTVNNFMLLYDPASVAAAALEDALAGRAESAPGAVPKILLRLAGVLPVKTAVKVWNLTKKRTGGTI